MSKQLILHNRLFFLNLMSFFGGFVFYAPVSLLVRTRCGVTEAQFFLLEAILSVSIFFFEVPCGLLSDRLGYKNTLIAGSCFLFAARLLMFCSDRFWLFAVEAVAEGIASALFSGTFSAYLYEVEPQDFAENLSKNDNCSNLGFILSSLGFFVLYAYGGIDSLLFFTMLFSFAALVCSFFLKPVGAKPCRLRRKQAAVPVHLSLAAPDIVLVFLLGCVSVAFLLVNFFYVSLLIKVGIPEKYMTAFILVYSAIQLSVPRIVHRLRRWQPLLSLRLFLVVACIMACAFPLISNLGILLPMLLFPTVLSVLGVYLEQYQNRRIDVLSRGENRAELLSVYSMVSRLTEILFLLGSSALSRLTTDLVFFLLGALFLISVFACALLLKQESDQ